MEGFFTRAVLKQTTALLIKTQGKIPSKLLRRWKFLSAAIFRRFAGRSG